MIYNEFNDFPMMCTDSLKLYSFGVGNMGGVSTFIRVVLVTLASSRIVCVWFWQHGRRPTFNTCGFGDMDGVSNFTILVMVNVASSALRQFPQNLTRHTCSCMFQVLFATESALG